MKYFLCEQQAPNNYLTVVLRCFNQLVPSLDLQFSVENLAI